MCCIALWPTVWVPGVSLNVFGCSWQTFVVSEPCLTRLQHILILFSDGQILNLKLFGFFIIFAACLCHITKPTEYLHVLDFQS